MAATPNKIASYKYIDALVGKTNTSNRCPCYYTLMMDIQYLEDYKGLSIKGSYQQNQLVKEEDLSYTKPKKWYVYVRIHTSPQLGSVSQVNAVYITKETFPNPISFGGCPSYINRSDIPSLSQNTLCKLSGTVNYTGYETNPGNIQISTNGGSSMSYVSHSSTVQMTWLYNNYSQYVTSQGQIQIQQQ